MNNTKAINLLNAKKKGTFFKAKFSSEVTQVLAEKKKQGYSVVKTTTGTFRVGIKNTNRKVMKEKMAAGYVPQARVWGDYMKGSDRILEYTDKAGNYKQYAVLYSTPNKSKVYYVVSKYGAPFMDENGEIIKYSREAIEEMNILQPSYFKEERSGMFSINLANIENIW